jgi:hypothetical protein
MAEIRPAAAELNISRVSLLPPDERPWRRLIFMAFCVPIDGMESTT